MLTSLLPTVPFLLFCSQPSQEKVDSLLAERKKLRKQQHDLNVMLKQEKRKHQRLMKKSKGLTVEDLKILLCDKTQVQV
jgi:hypothetical protein